MSKDGFYHLGLAPDMVKILDKLKFKEPTAIQNRSIPIALEGKDIVGVAQTGTGKTMAFGIPTVQQLAADGGQALILVPTRELAIQVSDALDPLLRPFKMKSAVLIGGIKIGLQLPDLRRNPDVIIATPGRMNDHICRGSIDLGRVRIVILDEADRMLDMGFEPQVKSIMRCVPAERQTLLFSATMDMDIMKMATKYMKLPIRVEIAPSGTTVKDVSQELFIVKESVKNEVLKMLLERHRGTVLVFTRTKMKATRVARQVREMGVKACEIHSDRSMGQRSQAIEGFKRGRYRVLVATDIAARGIDISMIELVVNYDLPDDKENYVHRIGRTGRAGETGHAVTLSTPSQSHDIRKIESLIRMPLPRTKSEKFMKSGGDEGSVSRRDTGRRPFSARSKKPAQKTAGSMATFGRQKRWKRKPDDKS